MKLKNTDLKYFLPVRHKNLLYILPNAACDKDILLGYWKLIEFSNLFNGATNYISKAMSNKENDIISQFLYLRSCITDYNACYDYALQIIFFGFGFYDDFSNQEEYILQLQNSAKLFNQGGQTEFSKNMNKLSSANEDFKMFYKKLCKYRGVADNYKTNPSKYNLRILANNIKHQGGFSFSEFWEKENAGDFVVRNSSDNSIIFSTEQLHIFSPSKDEIIRFLFHHNENLFKLGSFLYDAFFPNKKFSFREHNWGENKKIKISLEHTIYDTKDK